MVLGLPVTHMELHAIVPKFWPKKSIRTGRPALGVWFHIQMEPSNMSSKYIADFTGLPIYKWGSLYILLPTFIFTHVQMGVNLSKFYKANFFQAYPYTNGAY